MLDLADGQRLGSDEGMGARLGLAPRFDLVLGALTKKRKAGAGGLCWPEKRMNRVAE